MPISFNCPFCGEAYAVKDEFAGKKAPCRNKQCGKVLLVPLESEVGAVVAAAGRSTTATPVGNTGTTGPRKVAGPSREEVSAAAESMAMQAFSDETPVVEKERAAAIASAPIQVVCKFCDFAWEVEAVKAGKNAPCPDCRQINKIPLPKDEKPRDWRDTNDGKPSMARRDTEPKLEGAWDTGAQRLSETTIRETGIGRAKIEYEPLSVGQKLSRFSLVAGLLLMVTMGGMYAFRSRAEVKTEASFASVISDVEGDEFGTKRREFHAAIHRASGEYHIRIAEDKKQRDDAINQIRQARARLAEIPPMQFDRNAMLLEVASTFLHAAGTDRQIDDETRFKWSEVQKDIRQTIDKIPANDPEFRLWAMRQIAWKLVALKRGELVYAVAREIFPGAQLSQALGEIGVDLALAGDKVDAEDLLKKAVEAAQSAGVAKDQIYAIPSLTALQLALNPTIARLPPKQSVPEPAVSGPVPDATRLAYAEGWAAQNRWPEALAVADRAGSPAVRLQSLLLVLAVAVEIDKPEEANRAMDKILAMFDKEYKPGAGPTPPPLLMWRTAVLGSRTAKADKLKAIADRVVDPGLRGWVRYELMRGKTRTDSAAKLEHTMLSTAEEAKAMSLGEALERELFVRHNTAAGDATVSQFVKDLPRGAYQSFAQAGALLSRLDP